MVQYVPQIYFTWELGDIKSLSVITMLIQVPGSFLFAFSLWLRVSWEGWSTWLVYLVTGSLQAILLGLAITYFFRARREARNLGDDEEDEHEVDTDAEDDDRADERTALLSNGNEGSKARPVRGTQKSDSSQRRLGMLYAATPPEHDSDRSSGRE